MSSSLSQSINREEQGSDEEFALHKQPLGSGGDYLKALTTHYAGTLRFKTGSGHIFYDLVNSLPDLPSFDEDKIKLCRTIADIVYPLAARLYAQAVSIEISIASTNIAPPETIEDAAIYAAFDTPSQTISHCFLSPHHEIIAPAALSITSGMSILCEPFNYHYHQLKDRVGLRPRHAGSALPNRDWANRYVDRRDDPTSSRSLTAIELGLNRSHQSSTSSNVEDELLAAPVILAAELAATALVSSSRQPGSIPDAGILSAHRQESRMPPSPFQESPEAYKQDFVLPHDLPVPQRVTEIALNQPQPALMATEAPLAVVSSDMAPVFNTPSLASSLAFATSPLSLPLVLSVATSSFEIATQPTSQQAAVFLPEEKITNVTAASHPSFAESEVTTLPSDPLPSLPDLDSLTSSQATKSQGGTPQPLASSILAAPQVASSPLVSSVQQDIVVLPTALPIPAEPQAVPASPVSEVVQDSQLQPANAPHSLENALQESPLQESLLSQSQSPDPRLSNPSSPKPGPTSPSPASSEGYGTMAKSNAGPPVEPPFAPVTPENKSETVAPASARSSSLVSPVTELYVSPAHSNLTETLVHLVEFEELTRSLEPSHTMPVSSAPEHAEASTSEHREARAAASTNNAAPHRMTPSVSRFNPETDFSKAPPHGVSADHLVHFVEFEELIKAAKPQANSSYIRTPGADQKSQPAQSSPAEKAARNTPRYVTPQVAGASGASINANFFYDLEPWAQKYWRHRFELQRQAAKSGPSPTPGVKPQPSVGKAETFTKASTPQHTVGIHHFPYPGMMPHLGDKEET